MSEPVYYSVQTLLAYQLQLWILHNFCIFVSTEFNPIGNDPTSRPLLIAQRNCRIASQQYSEDELDWWNGLRLYLQSILLDEFEKRKDSPDHLLTVDELRRGQDMIALATEASAAPVLMVIPHSDTAYSRLAGDVHEGYEETEEEYLIPDLDPKYNFQTYLLSCDDLDNPANWYWIS